MDIRIRFHKCDPFGHVNNAVYEEYLEEAAIQHARALTWTEARLRADAGGIFVARKHEVDYLNAVVADDWLRVTTWVSEMQGATAFRGYEITLLRDMESGAIRGRVIEPGDMDSDERGATIIRATTQWAFVDPLTGRPRRIPDVVRDDFVVAEEDY
ncbi:MAG: thioesterase family protein [Thermomicrobiales bacterium]